MRNSTYILILVFVSVFLTIEGVFPDLFWLTVPIGVGFIAAYILLKYTRSRAAEMERLQKLPPSELKAEKQEWKMKSKALIIVSIVCIPLGIFLPAWVNMIAYLIPLFTLSFVITREGEVINFNILLFGLLLFMLIPSLFGQSLSMLSFNTAPPLFDASVSVSIPSIPGITDLVDSGAALANSGSLHDVAINLVNFVNIAKNLVLVALPIVMIGLIAVAMYYKPEAVPGLIIKSVAVAAVLAFFSVLFPGQICAFTGLSVIGPSGFVHILTNAIYSALPLLMCAICIVVGYFSRYDKIYVLLAERQERVKTKWDVRMDTFHWGLFALIIVIVVWAFARFLMSTDAVGFGSPGMLALYIVITLVAAIPILFGKLPIFEGTTSSNVMGVLMGLAGLFLIAQAISAVAYNQDMMSFALNVTSYMSAIPLWGTTLISVGDTMLFTAVTESILFQIVIPALALLYLYRRIRTADQRETDTSLNKKIRERQLDIQRNETIIKVLQESGKLSTEILTIAQWMPEVKKTVNALENVKEKKGIAKKIAVITKQNQDISEEIGEIQSYLGTHSRVSWGRMVFSKWTYAPYFIVVVTLLPNLIFAIFHYFRAGGYDALGNLNPPPDFWLWAIQGPFLVFIVSGMFLTLIAMRYGWGSAILTHGLWNAMLIMLSAVAVGGLT